MAAGLTQTQLAKLVDTTASVICRLEDADYEGHSLAMLRRIGAALNQRVGGPFRPHPAVGVVLRRIARSRYRPGRVGIACCAPRRL